MPPGVERAALYGWGYGGTPLAVVFASTYPERTSALLIDGDISMRRTEDYPWEMTEEELEAHIAATVARWGDEEGIPDLVSWAFGEDPAYHPPLDAAFVTWMARSSATPTRRPATRPSMRMLFETDVRHVLPSVHVPTAVLYKADDPDPGTREWAAYPAERIPGAVLVAVPGAAYVPWVEEPGPLVSAMEHFLASVREEEVELDRVLATVLFTDVVGSTQKAAEMGDAHWQELLERHARHRASPAGPLPRHRGQDDGRRLPGDLRRAGAGGALRPRHLRGRQAPRPRGAGRLPHRRDRAAGHRRGRHRRAHRRPRRRPGRSPREVFVSSTVKDLVAGSGLSFTDRGEHELKGVPGSWRLYAAEHPQPRSPSPSLGRQARNDSTSSRNDSGSSMNGK